MCICCSSSNSISTKHIFRTRTCMPFKNFDGTFLEHIGHSLKFTFGVEGLDGWLVLLPLPPPLLAPVPPPPSQVEQCSMRSRVLEKVLEQSGHSPPLLLTLFLPVVLFVLGGDSAISSSSSPVLSVSTMIDFLLVFFALF